jgi:hypothetical protein
MNKFILVFGLYLQCIDYHKRKGHQVKAVPFFDYLCGIV